MKRWHVYLLISTILCCTVIGYELYGYYAPPAVRQPYQIPRHYDDTLRIAYIGDSWAAMHKEHNCIIAQMVSESIHRPVKVLSYGLHGKTSKEIYESLFDCRDMHFLIAQGCDYCFISAGINDTYKKMSTDYYKKSMHLIIQFMLANNIHPVILEIPDYDIRKSYNWQQPSRKWLRCFSMFVTGTPLECKQEFRNTLKSIILVKNYQDKVDLIGIQEWNSHYIEDLKTYYVGDGMHLNQNGYKKLDSCIAQHIIRLIPN